MRRCPSCQRTYDDEKTFCMVEGAKLLPVAPVEDEPQPTMFASSPPVVSNPPVRKEAYTEVIPAAGWSAEAVSQPPSNLPFAQTIEAQSKPPGMGLKIVGGLLLLALGLGLGYAVASLMAKRSGNQPGAASSSSAQNDSSVLSELKALEDQMTDASIKGDKATLERMLAEDYNATGADGKFYNRTQTIYSTEPMPSVTSWSVDDARLLSRSETSATLSAVITFRSADGMERQRVTDTFMKRNGQWQLIASQSTLLK